MSQCLTMRNETGRRPTRALGALLLALSGVLSLGCNAFAPSALGSLTASREEKRILKQAAVESFPSPADVGLDQAEAQP